jgi:hypothetical protein
MYGIKHRSKLRISGGKDGSVIVTIPKLVCNEVGITTSNCSQVFLEWYRQRRSDRPRAKFVGQLVQEEQ